MVLQRASCLATGRCASAAPLLEHGGDVRGFHCFFCGRREDNDVSEDLKKRNTDANISVLSTDDIGADIDSVDAFTYSESVDGFLESAADFLTTLPPIVEVATFQSTFLSQALSDLCPGQEVLGAEACLLARRASAAFHARKQRQAARATLTEDDLEEVPRAELARPLLLSRFAERRQ